MTKYFSLSLEKIGKDWGGHIVAALVYIIILAALGATWIGNILAGCFTLGYFNFLAKKFNNEPAEIADLFIAFKRTELVLPSILACVVMEIIIVLGFICLIIPGIMAAAAFMFTYLIMLDGEKDFWAAMMKSKDIVAKDWFQYCVFAILVAIISALGGIVVVGILVTIPIGLGAVVLAYNDTKVVHAVPVEKPAENPIIS